MMPAAGLALLQESTHLLCISHVEPDGDAVGSLLGLGWLLEGLGKRATLALQDPIPASFAFLPGVDRVVGAADVGSHYDLLVCLDASSADRMGTVYRPDLHRQIPLLVIDHHVTNTRFGTVNWIDLESAATCQMLVNLAQALGLTLHTRAASCLLTGLVTDTHCFRTSNTDTHTLQAAMGCMAAGANLAEIAERTLNRVPYQIIRLWGLVLPHVQLVDGVIWVSVTVDQLQAAGGAEDDGGLSNRLITVVEADISATFVETVSAAGDPAVTCSFRAKPGFDVSRLAYAQGGGGHPPAAGCTVAGTLADVVPAVVAALRHLRQTQLPAAVAEAQGG